MFSMSAPPSGDLSLGTQLDSPLILSNSIVRQEWVIICKVREGDLLNPRSQNRDLHPTDEDLSAGTPDLGHTAFWDGRARGLICCCPTHSR